MDSSASAAAEAAAASSPEDLLNKTLTHADVTEVTGRLLEISTKTDVFGRLLQLPKATVESFHQRFEDPEGRLLHLLDEFAKQVEPRPTWSLILGALRHPLMKEYRLAQSIEDSLTPCGSPLSPATPPAATLVSQYTHPKKGSQVGKLSSPAIPGGPGKGSKSQPLKPKTGI